VAWLIAILLSVVIVDLAIRAFYVRLILPQFELKPPFNVTPHPTDPDTETVHATTEDGLTLRGGLYRSSANPRGLILFFPELDGTHASAQFYAAALIEAGFCVLSFDFRGQGDSDGQDGYEAKHWPTTAELKDVAAIFRYIDERADLRALPLGVFGISRGSLIGLMAAAQHPRVRAVCGEGTYTVDLLLEHFVLRWARLYIPTAVLACIPRWHIRLTLRMVRWISELRQGLRYAIAEPWLPRLRNRPVLLIAGERDNYVQPEVVRAIADRIHSPLCRVWEVPDAKHNQARDTVPEEFDRQLVEFFSVLSPVPAENSWLVSSR